jgi:hypothetical protein
MAAPAKVYASKRRVLEVAAGLAVVALVFTYFLPKIANYGQVWSVVSTLEPLDEVPRVPDDHEHVWPLEGHRGDPDADEGAERERIRWALGADRSQRLPRSQPHPRTPTPRGCPARCTNHYNEHRPHRPLT